MPTTTDDDRPDANGYTRAELRRKLRLDDNMHAGDRLCAARALGLPFPVPDETRAAVNDKARLLRAYDVANPAHSWLRWMTHNHDPGDEDRSER